MDNSLEDKIEEILEYYRTDTSLNQSELVIAMLTELQETTGYLSEAIQKEAASIAGVSFSYVAAVIRQLPHLHNAPFQYEIKVCISDRCKNKGSLDVLKELQRILRIQPGQVTKDGKFLLRTVYCMHMCTKGPNISINGTDYHNVAPSDIKKILKSVPSR